MRFLFPSICWLLFATAATAQSYDWTGPYVGATLGYGSLDSRQCDGVGCFAPFPGGLDMQADGATFGVLVGYNYQFQNNIVLGIEADYSASGIFGDSPGSGGFSCGAGGRCEAGVDSFGTVRVRAGYAIDRLLPYVTAGMAFSTYTGAIAVGTGAESGGTNNEQSAVYGFGLDYAVTDQWRLRGEYLYVEDPGLIDYNPGVGCCANQDNDYRVFRLGVTYAF